MSFQQQLLTKIKLSFEQEGIDAATLKFKNHEQAIDAIIKKYLELVRTQMMASQGLKASQAVNWNAEAVFMKQDLSGLNPLELEKDFPGVGEKSGSLMTIGDKLQGQLGKVQTFSGAMNNLVHIYYWLEQAELQLENAQNRLANSQANYNRQVQKFGAGSYQAIQAYRQMEVSENRLARAQARQILNLGLISSQVVSFGQHMLEAADRMGFLTEKTTVQTAMNWAQVKSQIALIATNPLFWIALGGAAIAGLAILNQKAIDSSTQMETRRVDGIPNMHTGGVVDRSGPVNLQAGEHVYTADQMRNKGTTIIDLSGDFIITGDALSEIDRIFDDKKRKVRDALVRYK